MSFLLLALYSPAAKCCIPASHTTLSLHFILFFPGIVIASSFIGLSNVSIFYKLRLFLEYVCFVPLWSVHYVCGTTRPPLQHIYLYNICPFQAKGAADDGDCLT